MSSHQASQGTQSTRARDGRILVRALEIALSASEEFRAMVDCQYQDPAVRSAWAEGFSDGFVGSLVDQSARVLALGVFAGAQKFTGQLTHALRAHLKRADLDEIFQIMLAAMAHPHLRLDQVFEHAASQRRHPVPIGAGNTPTISSRIDSEPVTQRRETSKTQIRSMRRKRQGGL